MQRWLAFWLREYGLPRVNRHSPLKPGGCIAGALRSRQDHFITRATGDQGALFGPAPPSRSAHRRQRPKQTTVIVSAEAIAAATAGRIDGERVIAAAVHAARPEVRNVAVDLGTIRWTDPKTRRRVTFITPTVARDALLRFAGGQGSADRRLLVRTFIGRPISGIGSTP
jgi:hypothetical protein